MIFASTNEDFGSSGIRVVDLSLFLPGPAMTQVMADHASTGIFRHTTPHVGMLSVTNSSQSLFAKSVRPGLWENIIISSLASLKP